jgi:signal transduction histidine kinase
MRFNLMLKFTLMISLLIGLVGLSLYWYSNKTSREILKDELLARGKSLAENLAFNSRYGVLSEDLVSLRDLLQGAIAEESVMYGRIYDAQGRMLIEAYKKNEAHHREEQYAVQPAFLPRKLFVREEGSKGHPSGEKHYGIAAPIMPRKSSPGIDESVMEAFELEQKQPGADPIGYVEIGISPTEMYRKLDRLVWFNIALTLGVVVVGILIAGVFVRTLLRPVRGMIETAEEIAQGNLSRQVRVITRDEIGELALIFNRMAQSLQERDEQVRRQYNELQFSHATLSRIATELEEYKQELEAKVQERTQELAQKNVLLQTAMKRAQESDRLKAQFLANMSHELRTPLNAIIGFAQVLLDGIDGKITEIQQKDLTAIHNSGTHLLTLINDILDVAKIEAGRMELHCETIRLEEMIQSVLATTRAIVKGKDLRFLVDVAPDLPPLQADPMRIRQILLNLVSNAVKFTPKGTVTVKAATTNGSVKVSVADTGIGIRETDIPKLFKEFRQLDASTTRDYGGTGLGLALVKRFVEMHGGRVWVESRLGVGSTFSFILPLRQTAEPEPAALMQPPIGHPEDQAAKPP